MSENRYHNSEKDEKTMGFLVATACLGTVILFGAGLYDILSKKLNKKFPGKGR